MRKADQVTEGHQLLIRLDGSKLGVTCPCLITRVRSEDYQPYRRGGVTSERRQSNWQRTFIESRAVFPAAEAKAVWRAWHEREGTGS